MNLDSLPILEITPDILNLLKCHQSLVLQAPPGAGKTTLLPLKLLKADFLLNKKILMLEPRRLAASNAARFMAKQLNEEVGQTVGYSIRYQRKVSAKTRLEVVTEGILTRRLQSDPELTGIGLVIFDEFHERHLQSDLALAFCKDSQNSLRDDLKLLIMSATLDSNPLAERLQAPLLTCEGKSYPVTTHYLPGKENQSLVEKTVSATVRALQETDGDLLVFLPGEGEIRRCQQQLSEQLTDILICPLFGNLSFREQEKAIKPTGQRKIVLSTNIAETSLTIEGISVVIDSGYSRQSRFDSGSGLNRLQLGRISQASTIQRAGRAGRLRPGVCYRLWSQGTQSALLPFTPPEIRTADLSSLVLDLLFWGISDPKRLFWLDPPSETAWQKGLGLLEHLGALSASQQLNKIGQGMAEIPAHPRLARLLYEAKNLNLLPLGCDLVALLNERDPWLAQKNKQKRTSPCDILDRLEAFWHQPNKTLFTGIKRARQYWQRFFKLSDETPMASHKDISQLLAAAFPDRIGMIRNVGTDRYQLSSGQGVRLGEQSALDRPEMLIAVNLYVPKSGEPEVTMACTLENETLNLLYPDRSWQKECYWNSEEGRIIACEQQRIGALVLKQRPCRIPAEKVQGATLSVLKTEGLTLLNFNKDTERFRSRIQFLHKNIDPKRWPDLSDQALLDTLEDWLLPFLGSARTREELKKIDLLSALKSCLNWQQLQELDTLAPEKIRVPSGSRISLQYPDDNNPVLAVKLQEMFGQTDTPCIAGGRVPVVIHLLSPAGRPLQITQDLRHFWEQSYPEVKKEMRGRYPKHPWPDDPLHANPTAKTKRKLLSKEK